MSRHTCTRLNLLLQGVIGFEPCELIRLSRYDSCLAAFGAHSVQAQASVRCVHRYTRGHSLSNMPLECNLTSSFLKLRTRYSVRPCSCIPTVSKADRTSLSYRRNVSLPEPEPAKASTINTLIEEGGTRSPRGQRAETVCAQRHPDYRKSDARRAANPHRATARIRKFPFERKVPKVGPTFY